VWSTASTWEVVVKARLGKLDLGGDVAKVLSPELERLGVYLLPVVQAHALAVATLPEVAWTDPAGLARRHADPFVRLLIAHALVEGVPVLTADAHFDRYAVNRIW
jgi:PIN domain nuclease of toxin-antitoxin system